MTPLWVLLVSVLVALTCKRVSERLAYSRKVLKPIGWDGSRRRVLSITGTPSAGKRKRGTAAAPAASGTPVPRAKDAKGAKAGAGAGSGLGPDASDDGDSSDGSSGADAREEGTPESGPARARKAKAKVTASVGGDGKPIAMLVIAHPDDECMFFVPTLMSIRKYWEVHVLCLSTGNYGGLGHIRQTELVESCKVLGISEDDVHIVDDEKFEDGMSNLWNPEYVADIVADRLRKTKAEMVLTFDDYGVSGHPNHVACYYGIVRCLQRSVWAIQAFSLQSTPLWRKYLGPLDLLVMTLQDLATSHTKGVDATSAAPLLLLHWNPVVNHACMNAHWSQYVWFRRLFLIFSRYTTTNTLVRIVASK